MDISTSKAQRQMGGSSKTAASRYMGSKKKGHKTRAPEAQIAGQPSGASLQPSGGSLRSNRSDVASEPARSRRAIERGDGETIAVAAAGINIASCTVGLLHAIDVGLGVALVVYGGLVHVTALDIFPGPAVGGASGPAPQQLSSPAFWILAHLLQF